ncbi:MAG: SNF2-related protein [Myxococcota bacterium]
MSDRSDAWKVGSKLVHPFNPELGVGEVREIDGRFLVVHFPNADQDLTLAAEGAGLSRLILAPGTAARLRETGERVEVAEAVGHSYRLSDGRLVDDPDLWPDRVVDTPVERLARLDLDPVESLANRVDGLALMELREAGGLGSFLGGRIELFPHQLHAALRAFESDPVRWLLADEVGLGKTVEACLVLSALIRTGRARRALVVAPSTLTVQWLGELYRKFHQVFVLLDAERVDAVRTDFGEDVNPFEVHPFAVVALDWLASDPGLLALAREAGLDVVVLDEAHRLASAEVTEAVGPLVREARHAVLLTATPLQADREGFYRLFSLLHPEVFEDFAAFRDAVERGEAVVPCTSAVRRVDVGGLPPRAPMPVDLDPPRDDPAQDPRAAWLVSQVPRWTADREKALVFVSDRERLEALAAHLESATHTRVAVFHEGLTPAKRDIEVATFRESALPVLLCSEAGAEGRNFQFCHRMVHDSLPLDPVELEQRIGRLDRIGRDRPVEIVYFRHAGASPDLAALYERLGLFERPAAGLDSALAPVAARLAAAIEGGEPVDVDALVAQVEEARKDLTRHWARVLYRDAYTPEQADDILARVPPDLELATERFCMGAFEELGIEAVEKSEHAMVYVEMGGVALVDGLPGVPDGSRFLGTFDREEAIEAEEADFFASGHPLVEGLLLELEDGVRGRASLVEIDSPAIAGAGLALFFKDGPHWSLTIAEANGTLRPEWQTPFLEALPRARSPKPEKWGLGAGWAGGIRQLASAVTDARGDAPGELVAAAFFRAAS